MNGFRCTLTTDNDWSAFSISCVFFLRIFLTVSQAATGPSFVQSVCGQLVDSSLFLVLVRKLVFVLLVVPLGCAASSFVAVGSLEERFSCKSTTCFERIRLHAVSVVSLQSTWYRIFDGGFWSVDIQTCYAVLGT